MEIVAGVIALLICIIWEVAEIAFHVLVFLLRVLFTGRIPKHGHKDHPLETAELAWKGARRARRHGGFGGTGL